MSIAVVLQAPSWRSHLYFPSSLSHYQPKSHTKGAQAQALHLSRFAPRAEGKALWP